MKNSLQTIKINLKFAALPPQQFIFFMGHSLHSFILILYPKINLKYLRYFTNLMISKQRFLFFSCLT